MVANHIVIVGVAIVALLAKLNAMVFAAFPANLVATNANAINQSNPSTNFKFIGCKTTTS